MFIDHITMYAENPEEAKSFYEKYFKGESNHGMINEKTGTPNYFLAFSGGGTAKLEIVEKPEDMDDSVLGITNMAFMHDSEKDVDDKVETLREDGYTIIKEPKLYDDGYYKAEIEDPTGNTIELIYGRPGGTHCPVNKQRKRR